MRLGLTAALILLTACGEKAPPSTAAAAPSLPTGMDIPADGNSKAFALALIANDTKNFSPSDAIGAKFEYTRLTFRSDLTWTAEGYVEAMDEHMDCTETGTWSMGAAESKTKAPITWVVSKTNCAGRDIGSETRALVTLGDSGIESAMFR